MNQIKGLSLITVTGVLILGLTGCGSDNSKVQNSGHKGEAWSVGEQIYVREESEGETLQNAESSYKNYLVSDEIRFPQVDASSHIQLKVTTSCFGEGFYIKPHFFTERMQSVYHIYELLPKIVLFNEWDAASGPTSCMFEFLATNEKGDTHKFSIKNSPVILKSIKDYILIERSRSALERTDNDAFDVLRNELAQYSMPELSENQSYQLECLKIVGKITGINGIVRMDQFKFSLRDKFDNSTLLPLTDLCRIFLINSKNRVAGMTDTFVLRGEAETPVVSSVGDESLVIRVVNSREIEVGQYSISNPTQNNMVISLDDGKANPINFVVAMANGNKKIGSEVQLPLQVSVRGAKVQRVGQQIRFVLPPLKSAQIALHVNTRGLSCSGHHIIGAYFRSKDSRGLFLNVLDAIDSPSDSVHTLAWSQLVSNRERFVAIYFIDLSQSRMNPQLPKLSEITPPTLSGLKNNICSVR